jgi:hypothetical protein
MNASDLQQGVFLMQGTCVAEFAALGTRVSHIVNAASV